MVMNEDRRKVSGLVRSHLMNGRKVIFLYPKVRGEGASVKGAGERLAEHFPNQVGVLHGQMKSDAKNAALQCFSSGEKPIIAASTAVEVGVDVPNIGLMVVSGADRFGVAQLHQLRGRLARNGGAADFVMVLSKRPSRSTEQRLQALCEHPDGFSLAERDMEIRGFGDVLGDFQIGRAMTTFKLTRLEVEDFTRVAQHPLQETYA
jgi:ATP-dependent DNA helicase RecG